MQIPFDLFKSQTGYGQAPYLRQIYLPVPVHRHAGIKVYLPPGPYQQLIPWPQHIIGWHRNMFYRREGRRNFVEQLTTVHRKRASNRILGELLKLGLLGERPDNPHRRRYRRRHRHGGDAGARNGVIEIGPFASLAGRLAGTLCGACRGPLSRSGTRD